jgi:hypothetical protein
MKGLVRKVLEVALLTDWSDDWHVEGVGIEACSLILITKEKLENT